MFKSEYQANVHGFTCAAIVHKSVARKADRKQGFNVFKTAGYVLALIVICAAVF